MQKEKIAGWKGAFLALILIWSVGLFDRFSLFDALMYDIFVQALPAPSHEPGVLLVEATPVMATAKSSEWKKLIDQSLALGARRIAFAFPPHFDDSSFLAVSPYRESVVIGGGLVQDTQERGQFSIGGIPDDYPVWLRERVVPLAPLTEKGIVRSQVTHVDVAGRSMPVFSVAAAAATIDDDRFFINFRGRASELPIFQFDRLMSEGSVAEAFSGKVVHVGIANPDIGQTISIPGRPTLISMLELQGLAADTLAHGKTIHVFSHVQRLLLLLIASLFSLILLQPLTLLPSLLATTVLSALTLIGAWLGLWLANVWFPFGDLFFVHAWTLLFVVRDKAARENRTLKSLLLNLTARVQSRTAPTNFIQAEEHWDFVLKLIEQTLPVTRTIVLERVPDDHRVREVKALRCAMTDISEPRRDYHRTPYTTAISEGGMVRVDKYLKSADASEYQYLVALMYGGDILGFWAFGLPADEIENAPDLPRIVNSIARQISTLLYQRKLREDIENASKRDWRRHLADSNIAAFVELNQSIQFLDQRLVTVEQLFQGLGTAAALYDLWGRLVMINEEMATLLRLAQIPAYGITAAELIRRVASLSQQESREVMNRLINENKSPTFRLHLPALPERLFLLSLKPLAQPATYSGSAASNPFDLMGVLIELVDVSEMHDVIDLKSDVLNNSLLRLEPELKQLDQTVQAIAASNLPYEDAANLGLELRRTANAIRQNLDGCATLLAPELDPMRAGRYPMNVSATIAHVVETLSASPAGRRIKFEIVPAPVEVLAFADPERLPMLCSAILGVLLDDTPSEGEVAIRYSLEGGRLAVDFDNNGFGLPQDKIDEMLADGEAATSSFITLRRLLDAVAEWRGTIEISSGIGLGIHVVLSLQVFD